ncbi:MAG: hypothetical protein AAF993_07540 [Pseudomonadota bacterium]
MSTPLRRITAVVIATLILLYATAALIRVNPEEQRPGLRLSGTVDATVAPDWSAMVPRQKVWLQTHPWYGIPHSVTTVSFVHAGELYIPCARCADKRWPAIVAANDTVVVKVDDLLYQRRAVRVTDTQLRRQILNLPPDDPRSDVYLYHMAPPG